MRAGRSRAVVVATLCGAVCAAGAVRAADDVVPGVDTRKPTAEAADAGPRPRPGIDLAAHVDINVVLPANQWRVGGSVQNIIIGGGGRLVIDGNLTIGGDPIADAPERVRRTDEALLTRLRAAQRDALAGIAADPRIPAARRRALELATEADVRRVMAEVARLRDRYAGTTANLGDEQWQRFQKDVQECRRSLAEPFGPRSLVAAARAGLEADARE